jgi:DNA replication protein DnaC
MSQTIIKERIKERFLSLGLRQIAVNLDEWLAETARFIDKTNLEIIDSLVDLEWSYRQSEQFKNRLIKSGMKSHKYLEAFDLSWIKGGLSEKSFNELCSLNWIDRKENVILIGPSGLGKTHLLLGIGHKACREGYNVQFTTCNDLMDNLRRSNSLNTLKRRLNSFKKPHLLLIDEVGYENLKQGEAHLFFQLINARYETGSILLTTNRKFGGWSELMGDDAIATATIDRLLHYSIVISLKGDSYRMKGRLKAGLPIEE